MVASTLVRASAIPHLMKEPTNERTDAALGRRRTATPGEDALFRAQHGQGQNREGRQGSGRVESYRHISRCQQRETDGLASGRRVWRTRSAQERTGWATFAGPWNQVTHIHASFAPCGARDPLLTCTPCLVRR